MIEHGNLPSLTGKAVLVTDIDSPMGYAIAEALVGSGACLYGVSAHHDQCAQQVKNLRRRGKASGRVVDLRNGMAALQLAHVMSEELPQLHLVVSITRIAEIDPAEELLRGFSQGGVEVFGEMAFVLELLPALRAASTPVARAHVVLVGNFSQSPVQMNFGTRANEIASHLAEQGVNLNVIDLSLVEATTESDATLFVLSALTKLFSAGARGRRGEDEGLFH